MAEQNPDAKINGDGTVPAGTYGAITLNGAGTITGDVECAELKVNGAGRCQGAVRADRVTINGTGTFDGPVQAGEFVANGNADVHAGMGAGRMRVFGTVALDGGLNVRELELKGELRVGAGVEADRVTGQGRFVVNGKFKANDIEFRLHGRSSANEIDAQRLILRAPEGFAAVLSSVVERKLIAPRVLGGELQLVDTESSLVRGAKVTLGEGCRVGRAEYSDVLQKLAGALVTEEVKI